MGAEERGGNVANPPGKSVAERAARREPVCRRILSNALNTQGNSPVDPSRPAPEGGSGVAKSATWARKCAKWSSEMLLLALSVAVAPGSMVLPDHLAVDARGEAAALGHPGARG